VDFIGKAALQEQLRTGLKKRLTCFTLDGKQRPLWGLEAVWDDRFPESPVGYLRRADYGFTLQKGIGYGYVNQMPNDQTSGDTWLKRIEAGTYSIEIMGERVPAQAHLKSVFDPKNLRVRGK